jgi:hypothetical protein
MSGGDTLFVRVCGKAGQLIAAAQWRCLCQQIGKIAKFVTASADCRTVHCEHRLLA